MRVLLAGVAALTLSIAASAQAQTTAAEPSITLYELPAYLGRSVTITADTPDLARQNFAQRARSAKVNGEWQLCPTANFAGSCRTVSVDQPVISKRLVVSLRAPANAVAAAAATNATTAAASGSSTAVAAASSLDLSALDVGAGTEGQDVNFYPRPALSGTEVSAGMNDIASATTFCKLAGASAAISAGRARTQTSSIIDVGTKSRARGYALRDVVCRM